MLNWCLRYERRILAAIIGLGFLASVSYSFFFRIQPMVDAKAYDNIAWDWARGLGYSTSAENRPGPGYELFLGIIYRFFGHSYELVWLIQAAMLALSAWLVFKISKLALGVNWHPLAGLAAAALVAFSPDLITISSMLMVETLFIFLMTAGSYFFLRAFQNKSVSWLILAAVFIAGSVLTRSNILFLVVPLVGFLFYKKRYKDAALFLAVFLLCLVPWTVRNYKVYGEFRPFNAASAIVWVGNNPISTGELGSYPLPDGYGDFSKMSQVEIDRALRRAGTDYVLANPVDFLKKTFWRTSIYFSFARPFAFWPHLQGIWRLGTVIASGLYSIVVFVLGLAGFAAVVFKRSVFAQTGFLTLLFLMFLAAPFPIIFLIVETRYRFPSYPFLAVAAGIFIYTLFVSRQVILQNRKRFLIILAVLLGNTAFDVVRNLNRILERI